MASAVRIDAPSVNNNQYFALSVFMMANNKKLAFIYGILKICNGQKPVRLQAEETKIFRR